MATATATKKRKTKHKKGKVTTVFTRPFAADGKEFRGRLPNGRVGLNQRENRNCIEMLNRGLGHQTIANELDLTINQVRYRAKKAKASVMAYRRGQSAEAEVILRRFSVQYKY